MLPEGVFPLDFHWLLLRLSLFTRLLLLLPALLALGEGGGSGLLLTYFGELRVGVGVLATWAIPVVLPLRLLRLSLITRLFNLLPSLLVHGGGRGGVLLLTCLGELRVVGACCRRGSSLVRFPGGCCVCPSSRRCSPCCRGLLRRGHPLSPFPGGCCGCPSSIGCSTCCWRCLRWGGGGGARSRMASVGGSAGGSAASGGSSGHRTCSICLYKFPGTSGHKASNCPLNDM